MGPSSVVAATREVGPLSADHVACGTYSAPSGNSSQLLLPSRGSRSDGCSGSAGSRCPIVELGTESVWKAARYKGHQIASKVLQTTPLYLSILEQVVQVVLFLIIGAVTSK